MNTNAFANSRGAATAGRWDNPSSRIVQPASAVFESQWQTYRKVIENNLMYHHEVYRELRRILIEEAPQPFHFLDVACGDASFSVEALKGTRVASYHGIDLSQSALDLASASLATLDCPIKLENRDFVDAILHWKGPVDVIWIGQSLHHLVAPTKLALVRMIREIVGKQGLFLIWEPTLLDGEDRDGWNNRFVSNRLLWGALSEEEFAAIDAHNRSADYPETAAGWRELGIEAGFGRGHELFRAPNDLSRMYLFR
jgi:Methyltransferase domain